MCWAGRKCVCTWGANRVTHAHARQLMRDCIRQHEETHLDDVDCPAQCDGRVTRLPFKPSKLGRQMYWEECVAYTVGERCLWRALTRCGQDAECVNQVQPWLLAEASARDYFCGVWRNWPQPNSVVPSSIRVADRDGRDVK